MSNTNRTAFASALSSFVSHTLQTDGKQVAVLSTMLEMETFFTKDWAEKFHKASGKNRTEMIHATLKEFLPEFDDILSTSKEKGKMSEAKATEKEKASNKLKALENLIRSCAVAISFFHLKPVAEYETTKGNRIRYAVKSKDGSNLIWDSKTGETFKSLKALGQELIEKAKWVSPATSAGKTTGNSGNAGTAASTAVSIVDLAEKAKATDNKFPDAFVQLCSSVCTLLDVKPLDQLSENEQKAFRNLEMTVIRKVFGDAKGVVDVGLINELYNKPADAAEKAKELQDAPKPDQTVAGNEKAARKPRKGNGKLMTAVEAENLKAPNAVKNDAETKAA